MSNPSFSNIPQTQSALRLGTDLVHLPRLVRIFDRYGAPFFQKLLTEQEWNYCQSGGTQGIKGKILLIRRAAGRIAVKEAVAKALGCGLNGMGWSQGVDWKEIEVLSTPQSPPQLRLFGKAEALAEQLQLHHWQLSLSHDGDYALATVIAQH
jgi:holo-[acyl-carrier protein] synthase